MNPCFFVALMLVRYACGTMGTAADAWSSLRDGAPCPGVSESEEWVFSCVRHAIDPDAEEPAARRIAEQEALQQMLDARLGQPEMPASVAAGVRAALGSAFGSDYRTSIVGRGMQSFPAGGSVPEGTIAVVVALPKSSLNDATEPFGDWADRIGRRSGSLPLLVVIPLLEVTTGATEQLVRDRVADFLRSVCTLPAGRWFPAWGVPSSPDPGKAGVGMATAVQLCELRPADPVLLRLLQEECRRADCAKVSRMIGEAIGSVVSPMALAKPLGPIDWQRVPVDWLPRNLGAVVRAGGALPASAGTTSPDLAGAVTEFENDRLDAAELDAIACAGRAVDLDALNLASAAIIRNHARLSVDRASVALALAWEAYQLDPGHRYAFGNVLLAMRELGMRREVAELLDSHRSDAASPWIAEQIASAREWLKSAPSQVSPSVVSPAR